MRLVMRRGFHESYRFSKLARKRRERCPDPPRHVGAPIETQGMQSCQECHPQR